MLGQSWLAAYIKFQPMITEFFRKVPDDVAQTLLHKVRGFVMAVTEPQQAADALLIVAMATRRCDDAAVALLLKPLLLMVEDDARALLGALLARRHAAP